MNGPRDTIVCVDCGGTCHRSPFGSPELGWQPGDVVTYRCTDCADLWYLEVDEDDLNGRSTGGVTGEGLEGPANPP